MARDLCDCVPIVDWVCRRDSTEYYLCRLQRAKSVGSELVFQKSQVVTPRALSRRWSVTAAAVLIAMVLHLAIVLLIGRIDHKHRLSATPTALSRINFVLIAFSAAFLALTVLSWAQGDYYTSIWTNGG